MSHHKAAHDVRKMELAVGGYKITSAIAVKLRSNNVLQNSSLVFPACFRCVSNHSSPFCAWLIGLPSTSPNECLDVTTRSVGVRADMKMMQPLLLRVRVYGGTV